MADPASIPIDQVQRVRDTLRDQRLRLEGAEACLEDLIAQATAAPAPSTSPPAAAAAPPAPASSSPPPALPLLRVIAEAEALGMPGWHPTEVVDPEAAAERSAVAKEALQQGLITETGLGRDHAYHLTAAGEAYLAEAG